MIDKPYNLKLLYVEDEPETRSQMEKFLKKRFARVSAASDGKEGLKKFTELKPDIIIADLLMSEMGGLEMIEKIRETDRDCPVLITSALEDSGTILRTVDLGIDGYIIKPIDTAELDSTLQRTAEDILRKQGRIIQFDIGRKKELEKKLKIELSAFLKKKTGKGPRNMNIFIGGSSVEVGISGFLTAFDESLLEDRRNQAVVEQNRRLFYRTAAREAERIVSRIIETAAEFADIVIDIQSNHESLIFKY